MKRVIKKLSYYGIPRYMLLSVALLFALWTLQHDGFFELPVWLVLSIGLCIPLVLPIIITTTNKRHKSGGDINGNNFRKSSPSLINATYPDISAQCLSKRPQGFVLGYEKSKYISIPLKEDGLNIFAVGTPGAGKSSMLKSWILSMEYEAEIIPNKSVTSSEWNYFMIDVDGLVYKDIYKMDGTYTATNKTSLYVMEPSNRKSFGFDVYYRVRGERVSETEKLKCVNDIADALIPTSENEKAYFRNNAIKILTGVLLWRLNEKRREVNDIKSLFCMLLKYAKSKGLISWSVTECFEDLDMSHVKYLPNTEHNPKRNFYKNSQLKNISIISLKISIHTIWLCC